jgi:membrane dipeptidase
MTDTSVTLSNDTPLVIDSHNDTVIALIRRGHIGLDGSRLKKDSRHPGAVAYLRQYQYPLGEGIQLDIPLMRQGGVDAGFFAVDTTRPWGNHLLYALDALGYLTQEIERCSADIGVALSADDIVQNKKEGRLSAVLAIENSIALEQSPYVLPQLYRLGVRTMTLTHSARSWAGDGCEVEGGGGLTDFGRLVVEQMNELGMLIDVSHLNEKGFWDVLKYSRAPVIASHSCCRALCDHPRNLHNEQLAALGEKGGVVGITFVPFFIDDDEPGLEKLLDHIEHAVEHAGAACVGLGSDFDGGGDLLRDAGQYPDIGAGLVRRGLDQAALTGILGANHLDLLRRSIG